MPTEQAVKAGSEVLGKAASFGPEMFLLVLVVMISTVFAAWYIWKVHIPQAETHRKCFDSLATAVHAFSCSHPEMIEKLTDTSAAVSRVESLATHATRARRVELDVIEKVANMANVDLNKELGELRGIHTSALGEEPRK